MKKAWMMMTGLAALMMLGGATAQTTAQSQTSGSASSKTSVSADKQGAQASTSNAASASQQSAVTNRNKQTKAASSAATSSSSSASASKKGASANLANGSTINAELTRSLDAKRNKVGDRVMARTTEDVKSGGQVVIPRGSKLIGHVTEAKARAKGESESTLGIVFDRAIPKKGPDVPVHAVVQAVAPSQAQSVAGMDDIGMGAMGEGSGMAMGQAQAGRPAGGGLVGGGGGLVGGVGSTVNSTAGMATNTAGNLGSTAGGAVNSAVNTGAGLTGSAAGLDSAGRLTSTSSGVIGLHGLNLRPSAASATEGSVITSAERNVHLDGGTQLLLRVASE
jgi:hypothetical protein